MTLVNTAELVQMRETFLQSLADTCVISTLSTTADKYGQTLESYADNPPCVCGFEPKGGAEKMRQTGELLITDAKLRLPLTANISRDDRVTITKRYGTALSPTLVFDVVTVKRGMVGLVVELQAVT